MKVISFIFMLVLSANFALSQTAVTSANITDPANYIVKWNVLSSSQAKIIKSNIYDNGTNIGIGTSTPSYTMSFAATAAKTLGMERNYTANNGNSLTILSGGSGSGSGSNNLNGGDLILKSGISTGTGVSNIAFYTPVKSTSSGYTDRVPVERMRLDANGNLGVGTTSPNSGIHILAADKTGLIVEHSSTTQWGYGLKISETSTSDAILASTKVFNISKTYGGYQELFTVWGNGVVNAKSLYAEKIEVRTDAIGINWPDYVFHKDYKLLSLYDVEKYYLQNSHLPEVPSANEIKEGMDLAEMNSILLKKIEELTLYLVQLQHQVDDLSK